MVYQRQPMICVLDNHFVVAINVCEVSDLDVSDDVEPALLHVVHEIDQGTTRPGARNQQKHLRTPEFNVILARVQH